MSTRSLAHIAGTVLAVVGLWMGTALAVTLIYREWSEVAALGAATGITIATGMLLRLAAGRTKELSTKEAFASVALAWIAVTAFGALPYLLTGSLPTFTDSFFESASGFTATGSSVVPDPGALSHGLLFWRAITQWLGGMGVVVLAVALLPRLGVGGLRLTEAEAPGPMPERVTPKYKDTARNLWLIFIGFTVVQSVLLLFGGMSLFEAVTHTFTTLSGGGFSTEASSMGAFSAYAQWVVIVFMIVGGTSFTLHYRALRDPRQYGRNAEFRLYLLVVAAASLFVVVGTWGGAVATTVRDAVFTVTSIITTTGFVTADYGLWAAPLHILIIGLMFVGAMAGSTSGSIKVYRFEVMAGSIRAFGRRLVHPRAATVVRSGGAAVPDRMVANIGTFFVLYLFAFFGGTIALGIIGSFGSGDMGLIGSASAVATSLGNVGPGLEEVGPTTTFVLVPALGKWLLSGLMIIGRLEILPVVVLFSRDAWRR